ncbi:pentapeptide repeat-containing protein [groundwater metagenome]
MNYLVKDIPVEKLVLFDFNNSVKEALEAVTGDIKKIAVKDNTGNYWIISFWRLRLLNDPNITLEQAFNTNTEIFETVRTVSSEEEIIDIIKDLYSLSGLIVVEDENIKGFFSLANFSESQLELLSKHRFTIEEIERRAKIKGRLTGIDLHEYDLEGIDLRNADLTNANLNKAILRKANLRNADITGAIFNDADLTEANLVRAKLNRTKLKNAKLNRADLRMAQLWHANLENAELIEARLNDTELYSANLRYANLTGADLFNAGLMNAVLEGADLTNADIRNANLKYATFDKKTDLKDIEINSITIDNLTENALTANWDAETKQIIKEKYLPNSFFLRSTSFFLKDRQPKYWEEHPELKGIKLYNIHVILDSSIEGALEKVNCVEYILNPTYKERQIQKKKDYEDKFRLEELAYGEYILEAKVFLKGKEEKPIVLQHHIKLEESGPRI